MKKPFGTELLLDCYNCDSETVDDINQCYAFLEDAVDILCVQKQAPPYVFHSPNTFPDKAGISAWVPLIESGIQLHTLTAKNFVSIDYYTCSKITKEIKKKLIDLAKEAFGTNKIRQKLIFRGIYYYD